MSDRCTICATPMDRHGGGLVFVYEGQKFFFCSLDCLKIFQAYPETYTTDEESSLSAIEDTGF